MSHLKLLFVYNNFWYENLVNGISISDWERSSKDYLNTLHIVGSSFSRCLILLAGKARSVHWTFEVCVVFVNTSLVLCTHFVWELELWHWMWGVVVDFLGVRCVCAHVWTFVPVWILPNWAVPGYTLIPTWAEVRSAPDGAIVLHHASIIHREPEKVAECVCLLNN